MGERFTRRRIKIIGSLVLLSLGLLVVPSSVSEKVKLSAASVLTPIQQAASWIGGLFRKTVPDPAVKAQLDHALKTLAEEKLKNKQLSTALLSVQALQEFDVEKRFDVILADVVVPSDGSPWRSSFTLAKGSVHGVKAGQIVVYQHFLVGKIHQVGPLTSRVVLLTDPGFKTGAVALSLTDKSASRQVGVAQGNGASRVSLRWICDVNELRQGQFVVTTEDPTLGIPKGLVIGRILSLDQIRGTFPEIVVDPAVQPRSLEFVMILSPKGGP